MTFAASPTQRIFSNACEGLLTPFAQPVVAKLAFAGGDNGLLFQLPKQQESEHLEPQGSS